MVNVLKLSLIDDDNGFFSGVPIVQKSAHIHSPEIYVYQIRKPETIRHTERNAIIHVMIVQMETHTHTANTRLLYMVAVDINKHVSTEGEACHVNGAILCKLRWMTFFYGNLY